MERGKLIAIEGTDCSGKETQTKLLKEKLEKEGKKVIIYSFPNYNSPTGRIVGGPYLGKPEIGDSYFGEEALRLDPMITSLYYAADRKYNTTDVYKQLDEGYYVLLDRYVSSNQAHQGGKIFDENKRRDLYTWLDVLEYQLLDLPKPDMTIFLHMPFEYSKILKKNRTALDIHEKSDEHLKNAEKAYLELADIYSWNTIECVKDNTIRTIEDISEEALSNVHELSKEKVKQLSFFKES